MKLLSRYQIRIAIAIFASGVGMTACIEADFSSGGRQTKLKGHGKTLGTEGDENNDGDATSRKHSPDKNGDQDNPEYQYTPITRSIDAPGWADQSVTRKLKDLFSPTDDGLGGSDSDGVTAETDNNNNTSGQPTGSDDGSGGGPNNPGGPLPPTGSDNPRTPGNPGDPGDPKTTDNPNDPNNPNRPSTTDSGVPSFSDSDNGVFWVPCDGGSQGSGTISGPAGVKVRVAGELCPVKTAQGALNVVFVVDYSGSMTGFSEGPNDPGDNCGRMQAANALLQKFSGPEYKGYELKFALVGFSNGANVRLGFQDLTSMRNTITPNIWCGSDSPAAMTNYRAAFEVTQQLTTSVPGRVVIYFISDGSPTTGAGFGGSPAQAGLVAANALRSSRPVDELVLNAVFLGYRSGQAVNPQGYLEQITGDPNRVRLVNGADGLVQAVQQLDAGTAKIAQSDVVATLKVGGDEDSIPIQTVIPHKSKGGAFIYMTEPFVLTGKAGKPVSNSIEIVAKTDSGEEVKSGATIQYTETD